MAYVKTDWVDNVTPLSADNMNKPETETARLSALIDLGVAADATPQLGGEFDMNGHSIGGAEYNNGNSGTSKTIDWRIGNHQMVTMNGNCTFTFTAPTKACALSIRFINDSTSGRTITLPAIKWQGGVAPVWTKLANTIDLLSLYFDGTTYYGMAGLAFA